MSTPCARWFLRSGLRNGSSWNARARDLSKLHHARPLHGEPLYESTSLRSLGAGKLLCRRNALSGPRSGTRQDQTRLLLGSGLR